MHLTGPQAFYNQPNYEQVTRAELRAISPPQTPVYTYENGSKWVRLASNVIFNGSSLVLMYTITAFCLKKISKSYLNPPAFPKTVIWLTLPIALYNDLYILAGWGIHPASLPFLFPVIRYFGGIDFDAMREDFLDGEREAKRMSVQANGYLIDTLILGKKENLGNGRWIIFSSGNGEVYEARREDYIRLADALSANIVFYNLASIGRSSGLLPNRSAILASHQAMHAFVREELGAKEIVGFGHSIGGGIQGENLKTLPLDDRIKYVFVKHMTFGTLSELVKVIIHRVAGSVIPYLNWDYSSVESSKALKHPEIIIQQGKIVGNYEIMQSTEQLTERDPVITGAESLSKALFDDPSCPKRNKVFFVVGDSHNREMRYPESFAPCIDNLLRA